MSALWVVLVNRWTLAAADLSNANLSGANLTGIKSGLIVGSPSALPIDWQLTQKYLIGPGTNLTGAMKVGIVVVVRAVE